MTAYSTERRHVLRVLATFLRTSLDRESEWLRESEQSAHETVDEPTHRRRVKVARALIARLEKGGGSPRTIEELAGVLEDGLRALADDAERAT